ncbi:MAG TPA: glycosyl transferase, partial [Nitrosopumilaceae archaeon]|nr:glycosyl transferase [Nitrosopumilaceae archaeon]
TFKKSTSQKPHKVTKAEKMANGYYKLAVVGIIGFIIFGVVVAFEGYKNAVYPLEESRGILSRIQATSDPQQIITDLRTVKVLLPKDGNPVWIFPTDSTDFGLIQKDLDTMISTVDKISTSSQDSASFHTGMFNMHFQAQTIFTNLMDAIPYMYVSLSNIIFSAVWIGAIIGIFAVIKRKKEHLKSYEMSDEV